MLKTITKSSNKKIGEIAATYRSGLGDVYSTCPAGCPLKPDTSQGSSEVDLAYLGALLDAVPADGLSWTYTHFHHSLIPSPRFDKTTINISTDSVEDAVEAFNAGHPTVIVTPTDQDAKVDHVAGVRLVRCPAEYRDEITCKTCGSGRPLCTLQNRSYVVKFTAHGSGAKKIAVRHAALEAREGATGAPQATVASGGCYGSGGPVQIQWRRTMGSTESDADQLRQFVATLPAGSMIRHHVVGDVGKQN